jgi:hypothetical protein
VINKNILLEKARTIKKETKTIEFKQSIDTTSTADWCEIIKDIVAFANSGGGIILFGVTNEGKKAQFNSRDILSYDTADITNKVFKHTGTQFDNFELIEVKRKNYSIAALLIHETFPPMVFINNGTYQGADGKNKSAFTKGTLYYRHGSKSEPANSSDIEKIIEKEIEQRKKNWLGNIRKVITAPSDYEVEVLPSKMTISERLDATPIMFSNDERAHKVKIDEDSIFKKIFTVEYYEVIRQSKKLFSDFKQNKRFNSIMKEFKKDPSIYRARYLDINNAKGGHKDYYSKKIFDKLKANYTLSKKNGN